MEKLYAIVIRPRGKAVEVGFTKNQAKRYCKMFNRLMKGTKTTAKMARLEVSLPIADQARERSQ